jgi:hypothetical protein
MKKRRAKESSIHREDTLNVMSDNIRLIDKCNTIRASVGEKDREVRLIKTKNGEQQRALVA